MTEIRRLQIAAERCVPPTEKPWKRWNRRRPTDTALPGKVWGWNTWDGWQSQKLDKVGGQVEEPRGETPERKTGPARCRGIDAYGYPENGVKLKQEPWPRWRPAEPWRGQSTELGTGRPCHVTRSEERDEKQMNRHWNVRFPEIEGGQPVPLTYWQEHRLNGLQLKVWHAHKAKDMGEGDDRTSWPRGLQHYEQKAVEAWRREWSKLQSILGNQDQGDIPYSSPWDGDGAGRRHWDGNNGTWGVPRKGRQ